MRKQSWIIGLLLVIAGWRGIPSLAATRVAVLAQREDAASKIATLVEVGLADSKDVTLLERANIDAVLKEQQLQAAFTAEGVDRRVALGKLLQADVLVLLQARDNPKPALEVVVCETHQGLRLLAQSLPMEQDGEATAKTVLSVVSTAVERSKQPITTIVAVPALACNDLTFEFQHMGAAYARLVEQTLMSRKGTLVVELAEAQAIGKELPLGDRSTVSRQLPLYLLGEFRNKDRDYARRTDLHLWLKRGEQELGTQKQDAVAPAQIAEMLLKMIHELLDGPGAAAIDKPDPEREIKDLLTLAQQFMQVGQPDEALPLYEASVLLKDQADGHRGAAEAIRDKYYIAWESAADWHNGLSDNQRVVRGKSVNAEMKPLLLVGMAHAEAYMRLKPFDQKNYDLLFRLLPSGDDDPLPQEATDLIVRAMTQKSKNNVHDAMWTLIWGLVYRLPESQKQKGLDLALPAPLVATESEGKAYRDILVTAARNQDSPELHVTLAVVCKGDNPIAAKAARQVPFEIRWNNTASWHTAPPSHWVPPAPEPEVKNPDIQLVLEQLSPIDVISLTHGLLSAYLKAGPCDLFWTGDVDRPNTLWVAHSPTDLHRLCDFRTGMDIFWDGKYVWTVSTNVKQAEILVVDPKTENQWLITPKAGLPTDPIRSFVAAPLGPGRVCIAATIGTMTNLHSWLALVTFDPLEGGKAKVFYEARKQVGMDPNHRKVNGQDPDVAFEPLAAMVFHKPSEGTPKAEDRQVVLFQTNERDLAVEFRGDSAKILPTPSKNNYSFGRLAQAWQNNMLYWVAPTGPQSNTYSVFRTRDPTQPRETVLANVKLIGRYGTALAALGQHLFLFDTDRHSILITDLAYGPQGSLRLLPRDDVNMFRWYFTNYFGVLFIGNTLCIKAFDGTGNPFNGTGVPLTEQKLLTLLNVDTIHTPVVSAIAQAMAGTREKIALKVVRVDSQETVEEDGKAANAVDGNPDTFWHTQWGAASPPCPHEIVIELQPSCDIKGFTYLSRQDGGVNGIIKNYEFYVSSDGKDFGKPVCQGTFANDQGKKTVTFNVTHCRFIKLKALSEVNGQAWTSAAEIGVVLKNETVEAAVGKPDVPGKLKVGDAAPALTPSQWVKGQPVEKFEPGKIYVIEFWDTWWSPSRDSIPHLAELQKQYSDMTFIGMDTRELDPSVVPIFVNEMGDKMNYRVAMDGGLAQDGVGKMAHTWMDAAGEDRLPYAFVVGKDSKIAWMGNPMNLDGVLKKIATGSMDSKKAEN